jgi:two-component system probable response regulator PhcQ
MNNENARSHFYILFVDDEENARKYFDKGLKHNFNILTAANVDEAIKILTENHQNIAVVITDQRMPGGNGIKLLRFLRENYPHIIRLLTTAYSDLSEAIDAVNSGEIFRYIQKPWNYDLLQTELKQALDLFELRLDHSKLLHEKIMVKKKITRIERAKSLILATKGFNFIRFGDIAAQNFIKNFAVGVSEIDNDEDWKSFDFGNSEVLETKFFLNLIERIQHEIKSSESYEFKDSIDSAKLISLFEAEKTSAVKVKITDQFDVKVNHYSFGLIIRKLAQIAALSNSSIDIEKSETAIVINLKLEKLDLSQNNNLFTQNPEKIATDFYVNLLICYLLASHHGGFVETTINENQSFNCSVNLPKNPDQPIFPNSQLDSLENTILATMIF